MPHIFTLAQYHGTSYNNRKVYAIKVEGVLVGELKYISRPKNAGGKCWEARYFGRQNVSLCMATEIKALTYFKEQYDDMVRNHGVHADPQSQILQRDGIYVDGVIRPMN